MSVKQSSCIYIYVFPPPTVGLTQLRQTSSPAMAAIMSAVNAANANRIIFPVLSKKSEESELEEAAVAAAVDATVVVERT